MVSPSLILTPTNRLARAVTRELADAQQTQQHRSWLAPQCLSFRAWTSELQREYLLYSNDTRISIGSTAAAHLWQDVVDTDVFIGSPRVASMAQKSLQRIVDYALPLPPDWAELTLTDDSRFFRRWFQAYLRRCDELGVIDGDLLTAELAQQVGTGRLPIPERIELRGFDLPLTPLQRKLLNACARQGTAIEPPLSTQDPDHEPAEDFRFGSITPPDTLTPLVAFSDEDAELRCAAAWARKTLDESDATALRLAIVVPDLDGRVDTVERTLRAVFDPAGALLDPATARPWHVSLGHPLARWPMIHDALAVLALTPERIPLPVVQQLQRSPFLALNGAPDSTLHDSESALARLQRDAPYWITLREWRHLVEDVEEVMPTMGAALGALAAAFAALPNLAKPSRWAQGFQELLTASGFCHQSVLGRSLNTIEYQVLDRWHRLLESFAGLDSVYAESIDRIRAAQELKRLAAAVVFRERNPGVALEVLGVEEAVGSRFDGLWITGLDSNRWPAPTQRDPLLPPTLQRSLPTATGEACLKQASRTLRALLRSSDSRTLSFSRGSDEPARAPTPLLRPLTCIDPPADADSTDLDAEPVIDPCEHVPVETTIPLRHLAHTSDAASSQADGAVQFAGGTGLLKSQAACAFQAFARYRLKARSQRHPRPGLDPVHRGSLAHKALENLYHRLRSQSALDGLSAAERSERVEQAVDAALEAFLRPYRHRLSTRGRALERQRLASLLARWISDVELRRPPFTVVGHEQPVTLTFGPLKLDGTVDRIDRLANGDELIIDYKLTAPPVAALRPAPRMAEPQLPSYALSRTPPAGGIAFASLKPSKLGLIGQIADEPFAQISTLKPNSGDESEWDAQLAAWQTALTELAEAFFGGSLAVDPRDANVCRSCDLKALCRIAELNRFDEPAADDSDDD
ncbi:MAG: PD-(D/E)XK nuclease family protein [Pseudomonadota bacterium]